MSWLKASGRMLATLVPGTGPGADESIIRVFALEADDPDLAFMATNDGFIKQVALADLQPTRTYKSRAIMARKMKGEDSRVITVDLAKTSEKREIILFTNQAFALKYDIDEVPGKSGLGQLGSSQST